MADYIRREAAIVQKCDCEAYDPKTGMIFECDAVPVERINTIPAADVRLLVLPCKVGDIVFLIVPGLSSPMPVPVCSLTWRGGKWSINADREETEPPKVVNFQIGKTAFLTREDAEKALEGMKNDK